MQDTKIKNTGNSRTLGSVPNFMALYPDYESFAAAMAAKNLPIDLGPLESIGCNVIGQLLNKANLLPDSVEQAIWGSAANRTVAQALQQLRSLITTAQNTANEKCKIVTGSYVGNGQYGADHPNSLTFPFAPKIVMLPLYSSQADYPTARWLVSMADMTTSYTMNSGFFRNNNSNFLGYGKKSSNGLTISWYATTNLSNWADQTPLSQFNSLNMTYHYVAIG